MLVQHYWLWSLLFAVTAGLSSSSSSHLTSTTKKSVVSTSSSLHTISTVKKSVSTSSSHPTSTTTKTVSSTKSSSHLSTTSTKKSATSTKSTKTSSTSSTPTLSTFYLVAEDTNYTDYDGVYLQYNDNLENPSYPFMDLNTANTNTSGAATFNLLANGTLQYNGASGPQFASIQNATNSQDIVFGVASEIDQLGLYALTCKIAEGAVTCVSKQTGANTFSFDGEIPGLDQELLIYDEPQLSNVTLKVVPV